MSDQLSIDVGSPSLDVGDGDNITDWCLQRFEERYPNLNIAKDDIWCYLYGVMHAPDWRERYRHDLQRNLPKVPLANDFGGFRDAGEELMMLHIGYETCQEHPDVMCEVDKIVDYGDNPNAEVYRLSKLCWGKNTETNETDKTVLNINERCRLVGIPSTANDYEVSGRSPLEWAINALTIKTDKDSGIIDDPNGWHAWADDPFELVRHLRRLVHVGVRSTEIIAGLPPSLDNEPTEVPQGTLSHD